MNRKKQRQRRMHNELPYPAKQLWQAHGNMLVAELSGLGDNPGAWHLGGGTLLAKEWQHRLSFDLDITISTAVPARQSREVVIAIANKLKSRGLEIDDITEDRRVRANAGRVDSFGNEAGIDLWIHDSALPGRTTTEPIGSHLVPRLSTAQILNGKLQRDRKGLIRDAYDIAHARRKDSRALEQAVNSLGPKHQRRAEITFAARSLETQENPAGIISWSGEAAEGQQKCWLKASDAIHDAKWVELEIKTENHRVHATTINTAGERQQWLGENGADRKEAITLLEHAGVLLHLQNQYDQPGWKLKEILKDITDYATAERPERIVHTQTAAKREGTTPTARFTGEIPPELPRVTPRAQSPVAVRGKRRPVGGDIDNRNSNRDPGYRR